MADKTVFEHISDLPKEIRDRIAILGIYLFAMGFVTGVFMTIGIRAL